jgi:hypothetical protein
LAVIHNESIRDELHHAASVSRGDCKIAASRIHAELAPWAPGVRRYFG